MSDQPQPLLVTLRRGNSPALGPAGLNQTRTVDRGGVGINAGEHHLAGVNPTQDYGVIGKHVDDSPFTVIVARTVPKNPAVNFQDPGVL